MLHKAAVKRALIIATVLATFVSFAHAQEASETIPAEPAQSDDHAEPAPRTDSDVALHHQNAGVVAAGDGDFVLAEHEFRASLAIRFRSTTAVNHAFALEQLGRFGEAIRLYDDLLRLEPSELPADPSRETLERYRREARAQQGTLRVVVHGAEDGRIILDGVIMGIFAEGHQITLTVDPGEHRIAALYGQRQSRALVQLRAGEEQDLNLRFAPLPADVAAAAQPEVTTEDVSEDQLRADGRSNAVYWILGGLVLLAGAVVLGLALRPSSEEEGALPVWRALGPRPL